MPNFNNHRTEVDDNGDTWSVLSCSCARVRSFKVRHRDLVEILEAGDANPAQARDRLGVTRMTGTVAAVRNLAHRLRRDGVVDRLPAGWG